MIAKKKIQLALHAITLTCFLSLGSLVHGQLTVNVNGNGQQLVNNITGNGVIVSNVTFNCPTGAAGTFNSNATNLGLNSGVLLTSGQATTAIGPNSSGSAGQDNNGAGDPDLDQISGVTTFDACALEFDLVPFCDTIQIRYVFGSEEYDEYVCATVNDAFAFIISGPGYPVPTNIATIPGTSIPVSINSVNNGTVGASGSAATPTCNLGNSTYYTTNAGGINIEYDGFTVVLTAFAAVQACDTYRLKLAIADGGDGIFDSGVFLEENGISCTTNPTFLSVEAVINDPVSTVLVEDCINGYYEFVRGGDLSLPATIPYQILGTTTNGTDHTPLTGSVTFPANVSTVQIPVDAFGDGITEGQEFVSVVVSDTVCFGATADTATFIIEDIPPSDAGPDFSFCGGDSAQLQGVPVVGATYEWIPATGLSDPNIPDPIVSLTAGGVYEYVFNVSFNNGCVATDTATVNVLARPTVTTSADTSFCEGEGGVGIQAFASGGVAPLYYTWWCDSTNTFCGIDSTFDNDPYVNPDTSTYYYVQITGSNGCLSNIDSVFVTELPKPLVDAGPDAFICSDSAPGVILTPTISNVPGPYTYLWTPAAGLNNNTIANPFARPDTTTIYSLVVTGGNGCSSDFTTLDSNATVTVTVNPLPIAVAHQPADEVDLCLGDSIQLQGAGFGAGPGYIFEWSPVTNLSNPDIASPFAFPILTTEYVLTVFSNGCPSYGDTVRINVHTLPTIEAGPDIEICLGGEGQLNGLANGDSSSGYFYEWTPTTGILDPAVDDPIVSPDTTTTYYLNAISDWGCRGTADSATVYVISTPIANAGPNLEICFGDSIALQGSYDYTTTLPGDQSLVYYTWTPAATLSDPTAPDPLSWPGVSTWYYLTVEQTVCETMDSVLVTVFPQPVATVAADTNVICSGDSVQLFADGGLGGASYLWMPATGLSDPTSANPMAAPGESTVYSVMVSEGRCQDSNAVSIEVIPTPQAAFVQSQTSGCAPLRVNFLELSTDADNYVWTFGDGSPVSNIQNPEHLYEVPGVYDVNLLAIGLGGCQDQAQPIRIEVSEGPQAEFTSTPMYPVEMVIPSTTVQFTNLSQYASNYVWDFGDGNTSIETDPGHFFQEEGVYFVRLTALSDKGCADTIFHGPYVVLIPELFIPNVFTPNGDGINDFFLPEYSGNQPYNLQIFDRWGVQLYDSKNKTEGWDGKNAKGQDVVEGTYFYRVDVGDKEYAGDLTLVR